MVTILTRWKDKQDRHNKKCIGQYLSYLKKNIKKNG